MSKSIVHFSFFTTLYHGFKFTYFYEQARCWASLFNSDRCLSTSSPRQFELRCEEPAPEFNPNTGQEPETSAQLHFEAYNEYEFDDFGLSRLVVELLLPASLMERITTKYSTDENFESYPGQILFMMALDT